VEAVADLIDTGIMSHAKYKKDLQRGKLRVVRPGKGAGCPALVDYASLSPDIQCKVEDYFGGNPYTLVKKKPLGAKIEVDYKAFEFFSNYRYPDGSPIPIERQNNILLWANNACILNALKKSLENHTQARAERGKRPQYSEFYAQAVTVVKQANEPVILHGEKVIPFENNLPVNPRRLRQKLEDYLSNGYESLVKHNSNNTNARLVTPKIETLLLSLYAMKNKPYAKAVHQLYLEFLHGNKSIIDKGTGEIYNPADSDFTDKNGNKKELSKATVWQIVNKPGNRVIVDRLRNDAKYYKDKHEPHHHRDKAKFSLSKISMDDRDIPNSEAKAYYAFDTMSGCILGRAYSRDKNMDLVVECFRNMFVFLDQHGLGVPMEVEVEEHLMNNLRNSILGENGLFQYVRWCNPGNSQEKWAETGIRLKKLGAEKDNQEYIGRFYSKLEANRPPQVGEWNTDGMRIKNHDRTYEKAVAEDLLTIIQQHNEEHPQFKGQTRLQVLLNNVNPDAPRIDKALLNRMLGYVTETSIRRSQYVTVMYEKYQLPHPAILAKLRPNNLRVSAYYLPNEEGIIDTVYLYQGGTYICECAKIKKYSTARAEWDDDGSDAEAYTEQAKYVSKHRAMVKEGKNGIAKLIIKDNEPEPESMDADTAAETFVPATKDTDDYDDIDFNNNALNDF